MAGFSDYTDGATQIILDMFKDLERLAEKKSTDELKSEKSIDAQVPKT